MKNSIKAALAVCMITGMSTLALAESDTQHDDVEKAFDSKIEAAAAAKAASKIGELRGSLDGLDDAYLITQDDLDQKRTSAIGFPILREKHQLNKADNSVPMV